jgi:hypothetical protein
MKGYENRHRPIAVWIPCGVVWKRCDLEAREAHAIGIEASLLHLSVYGLRAG